MKPKLTDVITGLISKKGIVYEAQNPNITLDVPTEDGKVVKVYIRADNMTIRIDKE